MPTDATKYLLDLLSKPGTRRQFYNAKPPVMVTDALILREAMKAGVDIDAFAPMVADRIKREPGWTIAKALEMATPEPEAPQGNKDRLVVEAECVKAVLTRPRRYTFKVGDDTMVLTAAEVKSRGAFVLACLSYISKIPRLPKAADWEGWLADQVERAQREEVPEEATEDGDRKANVEEVLRLLVTGESFDDLMVGQRLVIDGYAVVNFTALRAEVQRRVPSISAEELRDALHSLGWTPRPPFRLKDKTARGWRSPEPMVATTTAAQRIAAAGNTRRLSLVDMEHTEQFFEEVE